MAGFSKTSPKKTAAPYGNQSLHNMKTSALRIFFGIKNIGENPVVLKRGLSLLQIAFFDIKGKTVPVKHVYQGGRLI